MTDLANALAERGRYTVQTRWFVTIVTIILGMMHSSFAFSISVLVFSKVQEGVYRHSSIPSGIAALQGIGLAIGWQVSDTTGARFFSSKNLARYDVVVWSNTAGDVLDDDQKLVFKPNLHSNAGVELR